MQLVTIEKGENAGDQFYGCPNFFNKPPIPKCFEKVNVGKPPMEPLIKNLLQPKLF